MAFWKIILLACVALIFAEAKFQHQKRETSSNICDPVFNNTNNVQCYCLKDNHDPDIVRSAECYLTNENVASDDNIWNQFKTLKSTTRLTFTNTKGISLKYIPTSTLKLTNTLIKLDVKYGVIDTIRAFAFANHSTIEEISIRDNQIKTMEAKAFAHHKDLRTINLDTNRIVEINRDVFIDLPSLEKLFLTSNKITTIHDRAFVHLINLRELEIDRNGLFSLNSETFSGLKKLQTLDLSSNNLEVIGDNTFLPLENLRTLNLEGNKIQMLDEKAFNGLSELQSLSLAHNKLIGFENVKVFEGLDALILLNLRANQIRELKTELMAPILSNFYGNISSLDVEDNNFPCDCRLDWFVSLMNKTQNGHLKLSIENLKCLPDAHLRERWTKTIETDKNTGQVFEDEESQVQNNDYEYYDDSQLNGRLFYTDVRDLINCSNTKNHRAANIDETNIIAAADTKTTKVTPSPTTSNSVYSEYKTTKVTNQGILDLSLSETTTVKMHNSMNDKVDVYTTNHLATVSAKPFEDKRYDDMASDEAKPDKIKAHRSIQDKETPKINVNTAQKNVGCPVVIATIFLCFRLRF